MDDVTSTDGKLSREERNFASEVRRLREERGWSQAELASYMGERGIGYVNKTMVSRIENATRPVRMIEAQALSMIFNTTVTAMTNPDGREVLLTFFQLNHRSRRRAFSEYKKAAVAAFEAQEGNASDLAALRETFEHGRPLDPETQAAYTGLIENVKQFATIDLVDEVEKIKMGMRRKREQHPEAP